jgi:hydroxymethylglutaryl-CoA lyase
MKTPPEDSLASDSASSYVSCIFEDPYDGPTAPGQVIKVTQALLEAGCYEISLGDTTGVGTPADVVKLLDPMLKSIPAGRLAGHFHDTYGQAVANVVKAYEMGLRTFDSSVAGLGGCPFARGAKGNVSTEDLVYTFQKLGVSTGVNLNKLVATGVWISSQLGIPNGSRAGSAIASTLQAPTKPSIQLGLAKDRDWKLWRSSVANDHSVYRSGATINIHLTRPKVGNALTKSLILALIQLYKDFSVDDGISRIVLSSEGKFFCTGMDLKSSGTPEEQFENLRSLFHIIDTCPKTTIAAIQGPCFGGGVGLAFVCDIRLATANTTFKLSEVRLGLSAATISKYIVREWGFSLARSSMLTAVEIKASDLAAVHIIHRVVVNQSALDALLGEVLDNLRFNAPKASAMSKELVTEAWLDPGGPSQAKLIKSVFGKMMAEGSEFKIAREMFANGIKEVDWESLTVQRPLSKL